MQNPPKDDRWLQRRLRDLENRLRVLETSPRSVPRFAYKPVDQPVSNNTLQNDADLAIPTDANAMFTIDGWLVWTGTETCDIKFAFAFPAGSVLDWGILGPNDTDAGFSTGGTRGSGEWFARQGQTISPTGFIQYAASTAPLIGRLTGRLVTGATAGVLQLMWAQNTTDATPATLLAGSWMRLTRVA